MISSYPASGHVWSGVDVAERTRDTLSRMPSTVSPHVVRQRHRRGKISDDHPDMLCRQLSEPSEQVSAPSKVLQVSKTSQVVSLLLESATRPRTKKGGNCAFAKLGFWLRSLAADEGKDP